MNLPPEKTASDYAVRYAFGLIECLVAIAVIGVLAVFLFPVLDAARARADLAQCRSNLRQIGTGYHLYAQDNDGMLPGKDGIPTAFKAIKKVVAIDLQPYVPSPGEETLEGVWRCPSGPAGWITYSPNTFIWELNLKRLRQPASMAILWDRGGTLDAPPGTQVPGIAWHGANHYSALYADGHVEGVTKERIQNDLQLQVD